jgi:hypothetical protein
MWFDLWHVVKETDLATTHIERIAMMTTTTTTRLRHLVLVLAWQKDILTLNKALVPQRREMCRRNNKIEKAVGWAFCPIASMAGRCHSPDHLHQRIATVRMPWITMLQFACANASGTLSILLLFLLFPLGLLASSISGCWDLGGF